MLNDSRESSWFSVKRQICPHEKTLFLFIRDLHLPSPPTIAPLPRTRPCPSIFFLACATFSLPPMKPCSCFFSIAGETLLNNQRFASAANEISSKYQSFVGRCNCFCFFNQICYNVIHKLEPLRYFILLIYCILHIYNLVYGLICFCCLVFV